MPSLLDLLIENISEERTILFTACHSYITRERLSYYALFGLPVRSLSDADRANIKQQFESLKLHTHPDYHPESEEEATKLFAIVKTAYETLTNPEQESIYFHQFITSYSRTNTVVVTPTERVVHEAGAASAGAAGAGAGAAGASGIAAILRDTMDIESKATSTTVEIAYRLIRPGTTILPKRTNHLRERSGSLAACSESPAASTVATADIEEHATPSVTSAAAETITASKEEIKIILGIKPLAAKPVRPYFKPGTKLTADQFIYYYDRGISNFSGVDLSHAVFPMHFRFTRVNFANAYLNDIEAHGAFFTDCNLENTQFERAQLQSACFADDFRSKDCKLSSTRLINTNFNSADLTGAVFKHDRVWFPGANDYLILENVKFKKANLARVYCEGVAFTGKVHLQEANLAGMWWRAGRRNLLLRHPILSTGNTAEFPEPILFIGNTPEQQRQFVEDFQQEFSKRNKWGIFRRSIANKKAISLSDGATVPEIAMQIIKCAQTELQERKRTHFLAICDELSDRIDDRGNYHSLEETDYEAGAGAGAAAAAASH